LDCVSVPSNGSGGRGDMPRPGTTTLAVEARPRPHDPDDPGPYPGPYRDPNWRPDQRTGRHRAGRLPDPLGSRRRLGRFLVDLLLWPLHVLAAMCHRLARRPRPRHAAGRVTAMESWADQTVAWLAVVRDMRDSETAPRIGPRPSPYPARI
jgi:hypothetical protein